MLGNLGRPRFVVTRLRGCDMVPPLRFGSLGLPVPFPVPRMMHRHCFRGVLLGLWALAGCAARGSLDSLESELRQQEDARVALEERLSRMETDLRVARSESDTLRAQLAKSGRQTLPSEQSQALHRATKLTLHSLMTGGWDNDPTPGDEGLTVLLSPVDEHGDLVKLGGDIELELLDLSQGGEQQRLGTWSFPRDEVADLWHKGLLGSGFLVRVPWQTMPASERLTVVARLKTVDGRRFDATHQVVVTPPAAAVARHNDDSEPRQYKLRVEPISLPNRMAPLDENDVTPDGPGDATNSSEREREETLPPLPVEPGDQVSVPIEYPVRSASAEPGKRRIKANAPSGKAKIPSDKGKGAGSVKAAGVKPAPPADEGVLESDSYKLNDIPVRR